MGIYFQPIGANIMSTLNLRREAPKATVQSSVYRRVNQSKSGVFEAVAMTLLNQKCTITVLNNPNPLYGNLVAMDTYTTLLEELDNDDQVIQYRMLTKANIVSIDIDVKFTKSLGNNLDEHILPADQYKRMLAAEKSKKPDNAAVKVTKVKRKVISKLDNVS